ncbi:MAG: TrmH family RNA methyltransferase [Bdellovibrionales bacterium]
MIQDLNVVLVRPTFSGNIGSAVRALANMGGQRLILVDPQCEIDEATRQAASGAQAWLERITMYQDWPQFYAHEPEGFRISLSRRSGKKRPSQDLAECLSEMHQQSPPENVGKPLYLFFGPEASGLSAEDMAWSHRTAHLPVPGEFKSMNLAQAVMLALFITQQALAPQQRAPAHKRQKPTLTDSGKQAFAPAAFPDDSIRRWLQAMGFSLEKRRKSAYLTLRRLLLQNWPTDEELMVLQAILEQNIRKLNERNSLALLEHVPDQFRNVGLENVDLLGLPIDR